MKKRIVYFLFLSSLTACIEIENDFGKLDKDDITGQILFSSNDFVSHIMWPDGSNDIYFVSANYFASSNQFSLKAFNISTKQIRTITSFSNPLIGIIKNSSSYFGLDSEGNLKKYNSDFSNFQIISSNVLGYSDGIKAGGALLAYQKDVEYDPEKGYPFFVYNTESFIEVEADYGRPLTISSNGKEILYEVYENSVRVFKIFHAESGLTETFTVPGSNVYGNVTFIWNELGIYIIVSEPNTLKIVNATNGLVIGSCPNGYLIAVSEGNNKFVTASMACQNYSNCYFAPTEWHLLDHRFENPIFLLSAYNHSASHVLFVPDHSSVLYVKDNGVYQIKY